MNSKTPNIKHENGKVTYIMRTGKTFVRSYMSLAHALAIVRRSKNVEVTDKRDCGIEICVDDKYFFPMEEQTSKRKKKADTDEVTE